MQEHLSKEAKYYRDEYENLRRKKNKEIERMKAQNYHFFCRTWDLIQLLNLPYKFVLDWYRKD